MRALGPQSVASFLKIALAVVYAAACGAAAIIGPLALVLLIYLPFSNEPLHVTLNGRQLTSPVATAPLAVLLLGVEAYIACLIVILNRISRIIETLTIGDPFRPENVGRLRQVGVAMIALEAASYGVRMISLWAMPAAARLRNTEGWFNPTVWFAVGVVFVLAEVFREGARLRREAELTI